MACPKASNPTHIYARFSTVMATCDANLRQRALPRNLGFPIILAPLLVVFVGCCWEVRSARTQANEAMGAMADTAVIDDLVNETQVRISLL